MREFIIIETTKEIWKRRSSVMAETLEDALIRHSEGHYEELDCECCDVIDSELELATTNAIKD